MSGFLRRLVERHGAEPATRPRAHSRFESAIPPFEASPRSASAPTASPGDSFEAPVARSAGPSTDAGPAPSAARIRPDESRSPVSAKQERPSPEPGDVSTAAPLDRMTSRPFPRHAPVTPPRQGVETSSDLLETPVPTRRPGPIVTRKVTVAARADEPARVRTLDAAGKASREPDVVRVQIGRVEVRALLPPAERPAPKPRETATPLSLDRYLARRGGP